MTARLSRVERRARTRGDLLAAAERRFLRDGYHDTALDDVADDAGYTKGAVYSAFGSKAELFLALYDAEVERRLGRLRELIAAAPDADAALRALAARPPDERESRLVVLALEFWLHAARDPPLLAAFTAHHARLRDALAELAPGSGALDPQRWALVALALSNGLALERLIDPGAVPANLMATVQRLLLGRPAG